MLADVSCRKFRTVAYFLLVESSLIGCSFFPVSDPNLRPSFSELTVALKPLQRLVIPSNLDHPSSHLRQEISVNSTP